MKPNDIKEIGCRRAGLPLFRYNPMLWCVSMAWQAFLLSVPAVAKPAEPTVEKSSASAGTDDSWAFQYRENDFRDSALLDLRYLNEKTAGEHGFIRLNPQGDGFVRGDGVPIRFWGTIHADTNYKDEKLRQNARWLAKMGVNLIRLCTYLPSPKPGSRPEEVNQANIDKVWRYVAAMKKEGIYTVIVGYQAILLPADFTGWGIPGYEVDCTKSAKVQLWGLMYFNERLQTAYKAWLKKLYGEVNPYTGMTLAQDPSVMIQTITEDGLLFYIFNTIKPEQLRELGRQYADWLKTKYGSLDKALEAWNHDAPVAGKGGISNDDAANGVMGFYNIWLATKAAPRPSPDKAKRLADQVEFLSRTMRKFHEEVVRYMREDLGCKQPIFCGNWYPADKMTMMDAERWSYQPGQVIAENHFFAGPKKGGPGWRVTAGDLFSSSTALKPLDLDDSPPFIFKHVAGLATFLTSSTWEYPNIHQSEGPFLSAVYGGLTGLSGICWDGFSYTLEYDLQAVLPIAKEKWLIIYSNARPTFATSFPAAALIFRNGYVTHGKPVVEEERKLSDMWERKLPLAMDHGSYKATSEAMKSGSVDPLAFFVGPVRVKYDGDPSKSKVADFSKLILRDQQRVLSNTGQVELNYGKGICIVDAPKAQGVCGFLDQTGTFTLSTVTITSTNHYAAILVAPLDDQPLATSKKVLVQVGTTARPTGWKTEPAELKVAGHEKPIPAERVLDLGAGPWRVAATHATVTIANRNLTKATLLDANGMDAGDVPVTLTNGSCQVILPPQTMYLILNSKE